MYDVICFGSAMTDIFIETGLKEVNRKIAYPVGDKIPIKDIKFEVGGVGVNVAVGLSRMGLKSACIGKIGDDESGKRILDKLKKEKVEFLGKKTKGITGYGFVLDSYERNKTILTYHGLIDDYKLNEIKKNKLKTKWMFFSSLRGKSVETEEKMVYWCKENGIKTAFNMDARVLKKADINLKKILKNIDIIILNKEEAQGLVKGYSKKSLVKKIHKLGPKIVVLTDGKNPLYGFDGEEVYELKPKRIKVVEVTGAGDAFTSGFLAGYIRTGDVKKSMEVGLRNSESVIQHYGCHNKLLNWKEIKKEVKGI